MVLQKCGSFMSQHLPYVMVVNFLQDAANNCYFVYQHMFIVPPLWYPNVNKSAKCYLLNIGNLNKTTRKRPLVLSTQTNC